jgi:hypothetical protein
MTHSNQIFTENDFSIERMRPYFGSENDIVEMAEYRGFTIERIRDNPNNAEEETQYYAYLDGGHDTLAVCHLDTVCAPSFLRKEDGLIKSPAVDNRLGAYIIMDLLSEKGIHSDILLTTDEEKGRSSARWFDTCGDKEYNWIFSFDRKGEDAALYQYIGIEEWRNALDASGFKIAHGISSDIVYLDHLGRAGVNVGIGYCELFHSTGAWADIEVAVRQLNRFADFWKRNHEIRYEYRYHSSLIPS